MPSIVFNYPIMLEYLKDYEFVLLSRYVKGGGDSRSKIRTLSSFIFNKLANLVLDSDIKDYTSGLFVCKKEIFDKLDMNNYVHGEFTIELLFNLKKNGTKIIELPYIQPYDYQNNSKSFPSLYRFITLGIYYVITIISLKFKHLFSKEIK